MPAEVCCEIFGWSLIWNLQSLMGNIWWKRETFFTCQESARNFGAFGANFGEVATQDHSSSNPLKEGPPTSKLKWTLAIPPIRVSQHSPPFLENEAFWKRIFSQLAAKPQIWQEPVENRRSPQKTVSAAFLLNEVPKKARNLKRSFRNLKQSFPLLEAAKRTK